jgi:Domain of unknown function (DUF4375)
VARLLKDTYSKEMHTEQKEPGEVYWSVIEPIWDSISIYDGPEVFLLQFGKVSPEVGHLFASHWCQSEVCNGGFDQFFYNSTGVLAPEAADGFQAIGLCDLAALVRQAMSVFGAAYPRDREVRCEMLEQVAGKDGEEGDPLDHLDQQFYACLGEGHQRYYKMADEYARQIAA